MQGYIFIEGTVHFGRVLVNPLFRGQGHGDQLLQEIIKQLNRFYPNAPIEIEAQSAFAEILREI